MNIDDQIIKQIRVIASGFDYIEKVVLFGSRVRGDNRERSDIDLAVYSDEDITEFIDRLETQVRSLLKFDISDINQLDDLVFKQEVETEGVVIYEKSQI